MQFDGVIYVPWDHFKIQMQLAEQLRERVKELESQMEKYDLSDPFAAIRAEIARARALHPGNRHLFLALVEEIGEIAEAVQRGDIEHARQEAVQVGCLAVRLIEEKDASWFSAENDEKPPESALNE